MKAYLILGAGNVGKYMALKLSELGYEVLICDRSEEKVNALIEYTTAQKIGDAANESFIASLGVNNFEKCFITISDNFETSLKCADLLKQYGAKHVVAFASNEIQEKYLLKSGADAVIFGKRELANRVATKYSHDSILDYFELDDETSIVEVVAPEEWENKTIAELNLRNKYGINVLGYMAGKKIKQLPGPNFMVEKGTKLMVITLKKNLGLFIEK